MSILSSQQPLDARVGQAQLLGQIRQLAFQKPVVATESGAGSFRAQLLQQVMDLCDRSSLLRNVADPQSAGAPLWRRRATPITRHSTPPAPYWLGQPWQLPRHLSLSP